MRNGVPISTPGSDNHSGVGWRLVRRSFPRPERNRMDSIVMASSVDPPDERDESAVPDFNGFVRARTAALLRTAYLLTGDRHAAEDLVQSALAKTHLHWHRLRSPGNA